MLCCEVCQLDGGKVKGDGGEYAFGSVLEVARRKEGGAGTSEGQLWAVSQRSVLLSVRWFLGFEAWTKYGR
jgi:hypothetical protein